jgi:hypothetical protein
VPLMTCCTSNGSKTQCEALEAIKTDRIEAWGEKARHLVQNSDLSIVVDQFEAVLLACKQSSRLVKDE